LLGVRSSITIHIWPSRAPNLYKPDICVFDLDPSGEPADKRQLDVLCRAALDLRALLKDEFNVGRAITTDSIVCREVSTSQHSVMRSVPSAVAYGHLL
jgi:hypothetical protein